MFQRALPAGRGEETTDTVGKEVRYSVEAQKVSLRQQSYSVMRGKRGLCSFMIRLMVLYSPTICSTMTACSGPSGGGEMPGSGAPFYHLGTTKKDQNPFPAQGFYPTRAGRQCTVY